MCSSQHEIPTGLGCVPCINLALLACHSDALLVHPAYTEKFSRSALVLRRACAFWACGHRVAPSSPEFCIAHTASPGAHASAHTTYFRTCFHPGATRIMRCVMSTCHPRSCLRKIFMLSASPYYLNLDLVDMQRLRCSTADSAAAHRVKHLTLESCVYYEKSYVLAANKRGAGGFASPLHSHG